MGKRKVRSENKKRNRILKQQRDQGLLVKDDPKLRDHFDGVVEDDVDNFDLDKDKILLDGTGGHREDDFESDEEEVYGLDGIESDDDEFDGKDDQIDDDDDDEDAIGDHAEGYSEEEASDYDEDSRMLDDEKGDLGSADDEDFDSMASDLEAHSKFSDDEDGPQTLRASKSWGNKSTAFYGSDYQRQKKKTREEADALEDEEEEAAIMHKRDLVNQLGEDDFQLNLFVDQNDGSKDVSFDVRSSVKVQPSLVTKEEKIANLKLRHPELEHMIDEYNSINEELLSEVKPKVSKINPSKPDKLTDKQKIAQLKFTVYSHYLMCLSVYFMLKMNKESTENHPVMEKLLDFRRYISKLKKLEKGQLNISKSAPVNHLKKFEKVENYEEDAFDLYEKLKMYQEGKKTVAKNEIEARQKAQEREREKIIERKRNAEAKLIVEKDGVSKRKVSKPIRINKSVVEVKNLMARKEKNPRTKNRKKSLVAHLKRRGQVRPMRDASVNYGGETTGINVHAKRGTKLT